MLCYKTVRIAYQIQQSDMAIMTLKKQIKDLETQHCYIRPSHECQLAGQSLTRKCEEGDNNGDSDAAPKRPPPQGGRVVRCPTPVKQTAEVKGYCWQVGCTTWHAQTTLHVLHITTKTHKIGL